MTRNLEEETDLCVVPEIVAVIGGRPTIQRRRCLPGRKVSSPPYPIKGLKLSVQSWTFVINFHLGKNKV